MKKRAYSSFEKESRIFAAVMLLIIVLILAAGVLELCGAFDNENVWEPTEVYPMANAKINWLETHHPGPWGVISDGN